MHEMRSKHVPALDGLRGIAIVLVIAHHQLIPVSFAGGFLGVDLFFVLSGFLITSLLLVEFDATGTISFRNFYMRRVLRLGPALVVFLLACLLVTYHLQFDQLLQEIKLIAMALCYSTNWRMALGWDLSLDPTAIIWSLSIEEQFYLLWPIVFSAVLGLKVRKSVMFAGLVLVIMAIMVHRSMLFREGAELHRLYYGTDTRADALLIGCLIGLLPFRVTSRKQQLVFTISANAVMPLSAVCLSYLLLTTTFTDHFLYLGGYTAVAMTSGVLVWGAANSPSHLLTRALELHPLRWLGKISYGLYLWHWLLLKATSFYWLVGEWDPWARFVVALGVAALSFYLVEQPFNRLKVKFARSEEEAKVVQPARLPVMKVELVGTHTS